MWTLLLIPVIILAAATGIYMWVMGMIHTIQGGELDDEGAEDD